MRYLTATIAVLAGVPALANGLAFDERVIDAGFHIEQPALVASLTAGKLSLIHI